MGSWLQPGPAPTAVAMWAMHVWWQGGVTRTQTDDGTPFASEHSPGRLLSPPNQEGCLLPMSTRAGTAATGPPAPQGGRDTHHEAGQGTRPGPQGSARGQKKPGTERPPLDSGTARTARQGGPYLGAGPRLLWPHQGHRLQPGFRGAAGTPAAVPLRSGPHRPLRRDGLLGWVLGGLQQVQGGLRKALGSGQGRRTVTPQQAQQVVPAGLG